MEKLNKNNKFKNPILPGFHPDPSICRVGEDYYLITSTFAYFPGIPIFHSKDLVNWRQIGHVLDRPSQLNTDGFTQSLGIFAPTIRYNNGIFYVITTNIGGGGNFIVTAKDPEGPWSDPYWLNDAPGIDPSLFFDTDGKVYYVGTRSAPEGERYFGNGEIWLQELDLESKSLIGEKYPLWRGAMVDAVWPEGPHLYKKDGYYYLMIAEGGTGYYHAVTIARSKNIFGKYEGNNANPILTHRHFGREYPIAYTGHADIVETQNGDWWMVALASRPYGGSYTNLGRETFLTPVKWEDGWPIVNPGKGCIESECTCPNLTYFGVPVLPERDDFDREKLCCAWNFIRTPRENFWSLTERYGFLRLKLLPEQLSGLGNVSFVCRRQEHIDFSACTLMEFRPEENNETAGMVLYQNNEFHFRFEYSNIDGIKYLMLIERNNGIERVITQKEFNDENVYMKITAEGQAYSFYYGSSYDLWQTLVENVDGRILSTEVAGGFVGTYMGLYASSKGMDSKNYADFDWFDYKGI